MRILLTGHKGYIGAQLLPILKERGHWVTGCDLDLLAGCAWEELTPPDQELCKDVRTLTEVDLRGHDCIIHLAALPINTSAQINPELVFSINRDASIRLALLAKSAGIPRFLFAGSTSFYRATESGEVNEDSPLHPLSACADAEIQAEAGIIKMASDTFSPTSLRLAETYGHSQMLRIDLTANRLLSAAHSRGQMHVAGDGSGWIPLIHCQDAARAFLACAEARLGHLGGKIVNIGINQGNYQLKDVAHLVQRLIPDAEIIFTNKPTLPASTYKVNFDRLAELLPDFHLAYTLERGLVELYDCLREHGFTMSDFDGDQFVRLNTLKEVVSVLQEAELATV